MSFLAPAAFLFWFPFTLFLYTILPSHKATFYSLILGWLFLPVYSIGLPILPDLSKGMLVSVSVLFCIFLFDYDRWANLTLRRYDIPMLIWCLCPFASSLSNGLGVWDAFSSTFGTMVHWGIPYIIGRMYVTSAESLQDVAKYLIIGGLIYVPFVLYEVRMSPQLHEKIYGFGQASWLQHIRYGGWRPKVFMQHGLMVAFWMTAAAMTAFWSWRAGEKRRFLSLSPFFAFIILFLTTIFCKSGNAIGLVIIGFSAYISYRITRTTLVLLLLMMTLPAYMTVRSTGFWDGEIIQEVVMKIADEERAGSLGARMKQEDLFSEKAWERPFFGWGGWKRSFPLDDDGKQRTRGVDSLWIIILGENGYVGLVSLYLALLLGPYRLLQQGRKNDAWKAKTKTETDNYACMSLIVILFVIDSLFNAMLNPLFITITGGLVSMSIINRNESWSRESTNNGK